MDTLFRNRYANEEIILPYYRWDKSFAGSQYGRIRHTLREAQDTLRAVWLRTAWLIQRIEQKADWQLFRQVGFQLFAHGRLEYDGTGYSEAKIEHSLGYIVLMNYL
jgi:hypothetical protein